MFGFSLPKLLVLIGIIALIWYGFKVFSRGRKLENPKMSADVTDKHAKQHVDMEECLICGDYVDTVASSCGKDDCPFPTG